MNNNLYRGSLETIIMKMLSTHGEMYGYEIAKMVKQISNDKLTMTEGALYPILHKLEANLLLDSYSKIEDNRVRKYYKLTEKGSSEMETYLHAMKEYLDTMTSLIFSPKIT